MAERRVSLMLDGLEAMAGPGDKVLSTVHLVPLIRFAPAKLFTALEFGPEDALLDIGVGFFRPPTRVRRTAGHQQQQTKE